MPDFIKPAQPWNTPGPVPAPTSTNTLADAMRRERDEQTRRNIIEAHTPDQMAQATTLARQMGAMPADVEGVVSEAEKSLRARKFGQLIDQHPTIGQWAAGDPRSAVAASDDTKSLGILGSAWDMLSKVPARVFGSGVYDAAAGLREAADRWIATPGRYVEYGVDAALTTVLQQAGLRKGYDPYRALQEDLGYRAAGRQQMRDAAQGIRQRNQGAGFVTESVLGGLESIPLTVAAALTRNPELATAIPAVSVGGNAYAKAEQKGLSGTSALAYAATQGGTEYLTERIPAGLMVEALTKRTPFGKALIGQLVEEIPGEQLATAVQDMADWTYLNPDKSFGDYLRARPEAALSTLIGTVAGTTAHTGGAMLVDRAVRQVSETAQRRQQAAIAQGDGEALNLMGKAAEGSALRKRDPEAYATLLRAASENGHIPEQVFVPAEAIVAYQQSDSYDQFDDPFADYQGQIQEALATGGDVVLPSDFALSRLPGTAAWAAVKDDIRLRPGGMSMREAEDFRTNADAEMQAVGQRMAQTDKAQAAQDEQRAAMVEARTQELVNAGFTPRVAGIYADLDVQRSFTRAERTGRQAEPGSTIRAVLPPALAEIQRADNLDVVINAMRQNKPAEKQGGKSLLDWIAARGGIEDRGGGITSMGGAEWHKGKPGKRKLLAPYNEAQGSMLGGATNERSPERVLDAAISEGYFPDLLAARENGEKIDSRVLLDAIGQELRGSPIYAEEPQVDGQRAAADELRALLEDMGRDPDGMTDAEIRAAVQEYAAGGQDQAGYEQGADTGPRGRFIPGAPGERGAIELFQSRNLSTLVHEFGHQWLEELRADATHPDASEQLKADWETAKAWFASLGHPVGEDGTIPREAHEYFARGTERYLMEGKAPSAGLTRLFETVRGWLVSIYRRLDALRAPISPEMREVFGRLIATDEEIAAQRNALAMQPAITDPAALGMTGDEFAAYQKLAQGARDTANAELLAKTMASIKRKRTKEWRDEREAVIAQETERLQDAPLLKSLRLMADTPISREWLVDRMGQDVLGLLPKTGSKNIHQEGGANPDMVAELAGFDSAQQMIEVLIGAQRQHLQAKEGGDQRSLRARTIENAADEEMARRRGDDPFNDGSIEEEAIAAVNNDLAGDLLSAELRYLGRRMGQQATPWRVAREWARGKVRSGTIAQEASLSAIQRHTKAVAKAGREAEKAILAGKMDEAFAAKQRQMLSAAMLAEAKAAYDEVSRAQARLAKIAKRKTSKSVDQDYLDQAHALLDAVQLGPRSERSIDRQGKWEAWAAQQEADGIDVIVPKSFEATLRGTPWSRLTVENALGLDEAVAQVMHLGRLKQTLLDNQEQREWVDIFTEAEAAAGNIKGDPPRDLTDPTMLEAIKARAMSTDASLLKMETVFDWLDGGDPNGVFNRIAFRPIAEAQDRENAMLTDYYGRIKALFEAVPAEDGARWGDKLEMPWTDTETGRPMRMERSKVIAMALNIGNEGNLQRLSDGYRVPAGAIEQYLSDTLTTGEWKFVQGVWDEIDTLWPQIEGLEKRVNGVAPEKIAARAFDTPHGPMRGGYYPAVYDTTRNYRAEENRGKESDLLEGGYTRATTRASSTKERAEKVKAPILLDLGVINRHLGEVIHDVTHREAVIRANRFLTSERVMRAVDAALGPEIRKQFRPWVKFVANSWAMERAGNEGFGKWLGKLRANVTVVGMGLRATTMVSQIAGYSNSIEVVGEAPMAKAIAQFSAQLTGSVAKFVTFQGVQVPPMMAFALERSGELRARMDTLDRDIRNQIAAMSTVNPVSKIARQALDAKRFMFHGIGYMDRIVSVPTWMAAYSNAIGAGMAEQDAVYAADKAVRQSQGAGSPKDMAAIVRGTGRWGEATKMFTMFYSYFSAQYQRQRTLARDIGDADGRRPRNLPKLASRAFFLLVVPPLLTEVVKYGLSGSGGPDDDEWWTEWVARKLLANSIGPIPLARDVFEPVWNAVAGNQVYNPSISPIQRAYDTVTRSAMDVGKLVRGEETKHATKDILETTGYLTGLVPGQVASATQFLVDVGNGDADPQGFSDWLEGLTTGKLKHE